MRLGIRSFGTYPPPAWSQQDRRFISLNALAFSAVVRAVLARLGYD